jgi:hypothetical protein
MEEEVQALTKLGLTKAQAKVIIRCCFLEKKQQQVRFGKSLN